MFETIRTEKMGGGLLTAASLDLNPVIVASHNDLDILVVQIQVENINIRVINAHGPQEDDEISKIKLFWENIETEIVCAKEENCYVLIQLDANAKVGRNLIKNDPHTISDNGRIMLDMVQRQGFYIANQSSKCKGTITRERVLLGDKIEKSVIDYFILCERMCNYFEGMVIDEEREFVLQHSIKKKNNADYIKSDHNVLFCSFSLQFSLHKTDKWKEFFNFKCDEGRRNSMKATNTSNTLTSCFTSCIGFENSCISFHKQLHKILQKCFTKIRINGGGIKFIGNKVTQAFLGARRQSESFIRTVTCNFGLTLLKNFLNKLERSLNHIEEVSNTNKIRIKLIHWNLLSEWLLEAQEKVMSIF